MVGELYLSNITSIVSCTYLLAVWLLVITLVLLYLRELAPMLNPWLIQVTGNMYIPAFYPILAAIIVGIWSIRSFNDSSKYFTN